MTYTNFSSKIKARLVVYRRRLSIALIVSAQTVALTGGLLGFLPKPAAAQAGKTWKMIPLGDSLTQGGFKDSDNFSYRGHLYNKLEAAGIQVDYTGMRKAGFLPPANTSPDTTYHYANTEPIDDPDHGGYGAYGIAGDANCGNPQFDAGCGLLGHMDEDIPAGTEVTLLMVGNNGNGDRAAQYEQLVNEIQGLFPNMVFFLAGYPNRPGEPGMWQEIRDKAKQLADQSASDKIFWVDLNNVIGNSGDTISDGIHTSEAGAAKIGDRFYDSMIASGVFETSNPTPTPPTPTPPTPNPTPNPNPSPATNTACSALTDENGMAKYDVTVPQDGTYTVWLRVKAEAAASELRVSVDSPDSPASCAQSMGDSTKVNGTNWAWINKKVGANAFTVPMVKGAAKVQIGGDADYDHVMLDRVILTTDGCVPVDKGENCVPKGDGNTSPIPQPPQSASLFSATLTGAGTNATGIGTLILNPTQTSTTIYVELTNLNADDITGMHIRDADGGNVLFTINGQQGTITLNAAQAADMLDDKWWLDVGTPGKPEGLIKGQIKFVTTVPGTNPNPNPSPNPTPGTAPVVGSQVFATGLDPVGGLTTNGTASLVVSPDHTKGMVTMQLGGIAANDVLSYHIHGPAGGSQDAVLYVFNDIPHAINIYPEQYADIQAGKWYIEVHTNAHQDGELNGYMRFVVTIPESN